MFITVVIAFAAVFAAVTGIASRRQGGGITVRDRTRSGSDLLAGRSQPRELPAEPRRRDRSGN